METNPIPRSRKCFRCICWNSVGTALSLGRIFSISSPPRFLAPIDCFLKFSTACIKEGKHNESEPTFYLIFWLNILGYRHHAYPTLLQFLQFLIKASILFGSQPPAPFTLPLAGLWPDPKHSTDEEKHSIHEGKHSTDKFKTVLMNHHIY